MNTTPDRFVCPAQGSSCETCLHLAEGAMKDALVNRGLFSEMSADIAVESTRLPAYIRKIGAGTLSCEQRQERAVELGRAMAQEW